MKRSKAKRQKLILLIHGKKAAMGQKVKTSSGVIGKLTGIKKPLEKNSAGRVYVMLKGTDHEQELYPSAIGAKWENRGVEA